MNSRQAPEWGWLFLNPLHGLGPGAEGGWFRGDSSSSRLLCTSLIAQVVKNLPAVQEALVRFLGREDPLEKG